MDQIERLEGFKIGLDFIEKGIETSAVFVRHESAGSRIGGESA